MTDETAIKVGVGTWVKLTGFQPGEEDVFRIVPEDRADYLKSGIPPDNPLARAIEGAKAGDKVPFHFPGGEVELTVLKVGRL